MLQSRHDGKAVFVVVVESLATLDRFGQTEAEPVGIHRHKIARLIIKIVKAQPVVCKQEAVEIELHLVRAAF